MHSSKMLSSCCVFKVSVFRKWTEGIVGSSISTTSKCLAVSCNIQPIRDFDTKLFAVWKIPFWALPELSGFKNDSLSSLAYLPCLDGFFSWKPLSRACDLNLILFWVALNLYICLLQEWVSKIKKKTLPFSNVTPRNV